MEMEVTTTSDESNTFKNNINIVQSVNKEFINLENSEQLNNESSETSSNDTKIITSNNSGASPKLSLSKQNNVTNSQQKNPRANEEQTQAYDSTRYDCQYFFEDEIFRIDKKGRVKFGSVVDTSANYSDDDDDEFCQILRKGEILVIWHPKLTQTIQWESSIGLADRSLMPGDIVRRLVPGKETQRGYCRDINMKADVKILGTKYVIKNVNAERLRPICKWRRNGGVYLDNWVGSTKRVHEKAVLRAASGCRIEISSKYFSNFKDKYSRRERDIFNPIVFYLGNTVIGRLPSIENINILTPDIPLHNNNKKGKSLPRKFTIENLYTDCVSVKWKCKVNDDDLPAMDKKPNCCVKGDDLKRLKRLNLFESCMLQIGDRSYLTYSPCDTLVKKTDWDKEQSVKFKKILQQQKEENQKIFVRNSVDGTAGSHHHYEKLKKKASLSLDDKSSNKLKRNLYKGDELSTRDTSQETAENEWISTEDEVEVEEDNCDINAMDINNFDEDRNQCTGNCSTSTPTMSTCSSPSPHTSPKHLTKRQLMKKNLIYFKKPFLTEACEDFNPKEGDEFVTESLLVYSTATVVWQDNTIETDIPSTQLYAIQHLDAHEFFPGDFVKPELEMDHNEYGVIQSVKHQDRTANVKWFKTYELNSSKPLLLRESECSVYDIKDYLPFQYRVGDVVLHVSNFGKEDPNRRAGQVIDTYIDGRVKIWWTDGHISHCWPQDLFQTEQIGLGSVSNASDDSWETESIYSEVGADDGRSSLKLSITESHILTNIEKARVGLARLQEIFIICPNLQNPEAMRNLLKVYKTCRSLDHLSNTNFFHEDHFMGIIERVHKDSSQSVNEDVQYQKNKKHHHALRIAGVGKQNTESTVDGTVSYTNLQQFQQSSMQCQNLLLTNRKQSTSFKCPNNDSHNTNSIVQLIAPSSPVGAADEPLNEKSEENVPTTNHNADKTSPTLTSIITENLPRIREDLTTQFEISPHSNKQYNAEKNQLLNSVMMNIEKVYEKASKINETSHDDSIGSIHLPEDVSDIVCVRLCSLLNAQLVKYINEICEKYYKSDQQTLFEIHKMDPINNVSETLETIIDIEDNKVTPVTLETFFEKITFTTKIVATEAAEASEDSSNLTLKDDCNVLNCNQECFQLLSNAPKNHKYYQSNIFYPTNSKQYHKAVYHEHCMLKTSLPPGVYVKVFEDRMDLLSVMIEGPKHTPYEDGMFLFDIQFGSDYPKSPPSCHYISYCSDRLNPNLYECGKVCVSLLGTWSGKDSEVWGPKSTLFQVIVSIQGLILVPEPYFNEAGYEKQKGTQQGKENSRMYNEMVIIKMIQATTNLIQNPPMIYRTEILNHFKQNGLKMCERIKGWMELSKQTQSNENMEHDQDSNENDSTNNLSYTLPHFPLVPGSRGFCLTLAGLLESFKKKINVLNETTTA